LQQTALQSGANHIAIGTKSPCNQHLFARQSAPVYNVKIFRFTKS